MKSIWIIVISIAATAITIGGAGYYFMNKKASDDKAKLQSQIDSLNKQVLDLQPSTPSSNNSLDTMTPATATATTTDETASWKTYSNSTYDFSFKYPANWEVRDLTSANAHVTNLKLLVGTNPTSSREDTLFNVQIKNTTLNNTLANISGTKTEVQKFGTTATSATTANSTTGLSSTTYFIAKGPNVFIINGDGTDTSASAVIGKKIVETFQLAQ